MAAAAAAAAAAITPTSAFFGKGTTASLFVFPYRRATLSPSSSPIRLRRRIQSLSKSSPSSETIAGDLLKKIPRAEALSPKRPMKLGLCGRTLLYALLSVSFIFACGTSFAAVDDSIRASGFGLKVATALRRSGWIDEAIIFLLATLPVIELRGAIPVGYWMRLDPLKLTIVSILGNMMPVPFIVLYLKKFAGFLSKRSESGTEFMELLLERVREKAGPVEEFQWLGLMLFVAVPFPGTGAWTGAIIAAILDMPFWSAVSANFFGVVLAGLLVNLLVNLGLKYAAMVGIVLFFISTVMWSVLRRLKNTLTSK